MNSRTIKLGDLNCQVVDALPEGKRPTLVVVLCHGYGAPGTDLVPLGSEVLSFWGQLAADVQFVFPAAPLTLDALGLPGGRAWWHVDIEKLATSIARGELRETIENVPAELPHSRQLLTDAITQLSEQHDLPITRFALGGFSQGSVLATDVALRLKDTVASLFVWSGTLVAEKEWKALAKNHPQLLIQQSHGRTDLVLPYKGGEWLRDAMTSAGIEVQFLSFDDGHTIPMEALRRFGDRLVQLVTES